MVGERWYQIIAYSVLLVVSVLSLYPLIYVVSMSLVSEQEWVARGGFILWPHTPTLIAYKRLLNGSLFINSLGISVTRTILGTAIVLSMSAITAYVVSRKGLPGRRIILFAILITILFNSGLIPTYLVVRDFHILNTIWSLIIPVMVDSWSVLVLMHFFQGIPKEIEESAQLDGTGEFLLMTQIIIPMSKPALAAIGLFTAVFHWNSWFDAFIFINNPQIQPLQLLMQNLFANANMGYDLNPMSIVNPSQRVSMESLKMAVAVIGTIPILLVYPFIQKHFTQGMFLGAVKG